MAPQPDSETPPSPTPRVSRGGLVSIPPAIQQIAAGEALRDASALGNPTPAEITDLLVIVTAAALETQITSDAVIDARAQTPLGRRLLQIMKEEVMQCWKRHGITEPELPPLLLAIERV